MDANSFWYFIHANIFKSYDFICNYNIESKQVPEKKNDLPRINFIISRQLIRGLSVKFVDTANKTRIKYQRRMKFCINKYQLSGTMHTQYDSMILHIDLFISH